MRLSRRASAFSSNAERGAMVGRCSHKWQAQRDVDALSKASVLIDEGSVVTSRWLHRTFAGPRHETVCLRREDR